MTNKLLVDNNQELISITRSIREFILKQFPLARKRKLEDAQDLLESGVIDSTGILELVGFIEQEFGILVADDDLTPQNFGSIDHMARYVESKRSLGLSAE